MTTPNRHLKAVKQLLVDYHDRRILYGRTEEGEDYPIHQLIEHWANLDEGLVEITPEGRVFDSRGWYKDEALLEFWYWLKRR